MSAPRVVGNPAGSARHEYPQFELSYLFDQKDQPSEITIYPESDKFDISTNWITVDIDTAIPLSEVP